MLKKFTLTTLTTIATAALTACGGGGGNSVTAAPTVGGGLWQSSNTQSNVAIPQTPGAPGSSSTIYFQNVTTQNNIFITPTNNIYTVTVTTGSVTGATYQWSIGSGVANGNTINGTVTNFTTSSTANNATGTTGISYTINSNGGLTGLNLSAPAIGGYTYAQAANISNVSGTWNVASTTMTISTAGAISGSISGCTFTGSAIPDNAGENAFNVTLAYGSAPCTHPNTSMSGIAYQYGITSGGQQLVILVKDALNTGSVLLLGQR